MSDNKWAKWTMAGVGALIAVALLWGVYNYYVQPLTPIPEPPLITLIYPKDETPFTNPERGFYRSLLPPNDTIKFDLLNPLPASWDAMRKDVSLGFNGGAYRVSAPILVPDNALSK